MCSHRQTSENQAISGLRFQVLWLNGSVVLLRVKISAIPDPERCFLLVLPGINTELDNWKFLRKMLESQAPLDSWNHVIITPYGYSYCCLLRILQRLHFPSMGRDAEASWGSAWRRKSSLQLWSIAGVLLLSFEPHTLFVRGSVSPFSSLLPRGSFLGKTSLWCLQVFRNLTHLFSSQMSSCTSNHITDFWKIPGKRIILDIWAWVKILRANFWCETLLLDFLGRTLLSTLRF